MANPSDRTNPNQPGITEKRGRREAITLDDDQRQMETILHNSDVQTRSTTWEPLHYQVGLDVSWSMIEPAHGPAGLSQVYYLLQGLSGILQI